MTRVVEVSFTPARGPADFLEAIERQRRISQAIDDYHRGGPVVAAIERQERDMRAIDNFRRRSRQIEQLTRPQAINQQ